MSGNFLLDWVGLAVSLFNAILLLWLGLTVLLNAAPYSWGIWLSGAGLLSGAAFFFIHSVILGLGFAYLYWPSDFWWYLGWIPVILAPFAWYMVMLWYTGFWEGKQNPVRHRHGIWFWLMLEAVIVLIGMFLFANPLPTFGQMAHLNLGGSLSVFGVPVMILVYPPFILTCILLSIDALLRPGPTMRAMGQLARRRARPWLASASVLLLLVSFLVAGFAAWLVINGKEYTPSLELAYAVGWLDLAISSLIAASILLTGQAIISYEVFTGKALPRRGLRRLWYWTIALAAVYSLLAGFSVASQSPAVYGTVLSTGFLVALMALLSRRSYSERQEFIAALRPFITSQQLYNQLFSSMSESGSRQAEEPFRALCAQVLGARWACLVPLGPLAPLFGPPLSYPKPDQAPPIQPDKFLGKISPETLYIPLENSDGDPSSWAIPLWNVHGLCGILMLGEKQDNSLYSQEEMETARTAGERLMDLQISTEISRRLMSLQRRQLAENQVLDRRVRRALHDDVLPRLHAVLLELSVTSQAAGSPEMLESLSKIHRQIADLLHDLPTAGAPQVQRFGLIGALQQAVEVEFTSAFDQVDWVVNPEISQELSRLPALQAEVLYFAAREAIRNAARHARADDNGVPLILCVSADLKNGLELTIQDNGIGIGDNGIGNESGGSGLTLHSTLMAVIGGALVVTSEPGKFTRVRLWLPTMKDQLSGF